MTTKRRKWLRWGCLGLLLVLVVGGGVAVTRLRNGEEQVSPEMACYSGVYQLEGGEKLILGPSSGETLRYRMLQTGRSGRLYPKGEGRWVSGPYWTGEDPVDSVVEIEGCGAPTLTVARQGGAAESGARIDLREVPLDFSSHGLAMRGKVVLPQGSGPFPTVVLVHGSERDSAVDWNAQRLIFPVQGVAAFVFDKRGTGGSEGEYTQDFHLLSDDVVAAVHALRDKALPEVGEIGLAGFSQGGWVAPLAATKTDVAFVLVGYGMAESPLAEDRDEALRGLVDAGYSDRDLDEAREALRATGRVVASGFQEGLEELGDVKAKYGDRPWFEEIEGEFSGDILHNPTWGVRLLWPLFDVGTSWDHDPLGPLESIEVPHLWIVGGQDLEAPPERTLEILTALTQRKSNLQLTVYPEADHGMLIFEEVDGERKYTGYAPGYLELLAEWVRGAVEPPSPSEGPEVGEGGGLETSEVAQKATSEAVP